MPRCKRCGNDKSFACSFADTAILTANPQSYGLTANFNKQGNLIDMECFGASLDDAQEAFENQRSTFDICSNCGGSDIEW